jgi:hypothetical protein
MPKIESETKHSKGQENMKRILGFLAGLLVSGSLALAAEQTWTGVISDSSCGRSHKSMIEHSGKKLSDRECTIACVKNGAKYVFVAGSKIYEIANQDFAGLEEHAGQKVKLAGELKGDTVTVNRIGVEGER